jgi:hypothetical protein
MKTIKIANWKTGEIFKEDSVSNVSSLIGCYYTHLYPLLYRTRFIIGDYCLYENLAKTYYICKDEEEIELNNWIKFGVENGLRLTTFKKLLDGEILSYKGFYLSESQNKLPMKNVYIFSDGTKMTNIRRGHKENPGLVGCSKTLYNLASGKATKTRNGLYLKEVIQELK